MRTLVFAACSYFRKTLGSAKLSLQECVVHTADMESKGDCLKYCLERDRKPGFLSSRRSLGGNRISPDGTSALTSAGEGDIPLAGQGQYKNYRFYCPFVVDISGF